MNALIAFAHIVGAVIVLFAFGMGYLLFANWVDENNRKATAQEASLALGIPVNEFEAAEHQERIIRFAAERFSSELLRNRLSDLCGWFRAGWDWLSNLLQAGVLLGVIWYTVTDDLSNSVYAWSIVAIAVFFSISSLLFSLVCKVLTGRYPGQARITRKMLGGDHGATEQHAN